MRIRQRKYAFLFFAPAILLVLSIFIFPIIQSFVYSLNDWDSVTAMTYKGLDNYKRLIFDENFYTSLENSAIYSMVYVFGVDILGFILALIIERRVWGWKFYRFVWFIPVMMSQVVVALLWGNILDPLVGPVNSILEFLNLEFLKRDWLGDPSISVIVACLVSIWQYSGITMLLFLTSMESIPLDIHDAATIDGVNLIQRVKSIILPLIRPVVVIVSILNLIFAMKVFDIVWVLTKGGPGWSSSVLSIFLYKMGFRYQQYGYASSVAVIMGIIVVAVSIVYLRFIQYREVEVD